MPQAAGNKQCTVMLLLFFLAGHRGRESVHPTLSALRWRVVPAQKLLLHSHPGRARAQAFQNGSVDRHRPPRLNNHALPTAHPTSVASASHPASANQLLPTSLPAGGVTNAVFNHCNVHCPTSRTTNPTRSTDILPMTKGSVDLVG